MLEVAYATGRASHARQVKGDDPDKKGYPGPPGWGFVLGLTTPHSKKNFLLRKSNKGKRRILFDRPKPTAGCSANGRRRRRRRRKKKKKKHIGVFGVISVMASSKYDVNAAAIPFSRPKFDRNLKCQCVNQNENRIRVQGL
jgi:hypothetical protein